MYLCKDHVYSIHSVLFILTDFCHHSYVTREPVFDECVKSKLSLLDKNANRVALHRYRICNLNIHNYRYIQQREHCVANDKYT